VTTDETEVTTYDYPCAFSTENPDTEPSLFNCTLRENCRGGHSSEEEDGSVTTTYYCLPRTCSSDDECLGDSTCRRQQCSVDRDYNHFARACQVALNATRDVIVRNVPCIRDNHVCDTSSSGRVFTLYEETYVAFYCQHQESAEDESVEDETSDGAFVDQVDPAFEP